MTVIPTTIRTERLVSLARWLTEQQRKRQRGERSAWAQHMWVSPRKDNVQLNGAATWSCGTPACAAGHIAIEAGGEPCFVIGHSERPFEQLTDEEKISVRQIYSDETSPYTYLSEYRMAFPNAGVMRIRDFAQQYLALTDTEAGSLFEANNNWSDMMERISSLIDVDYDTLVEEVGGTDLAPDGDGDDD